jgi:3,4-dihydroxy 2-butanone 4-phosphate synthase/GTP cyclohydrolase II
MSHKLSTIEQAIKDIAAGKMVILVDDESRENEGDIVIAAEHITPETMNFMIKHARGLVCMPMLENDFMRLRIPMMVKQNTAPRQTAFGVSIEAREGVTTGISAFDRATTVKVAANPDSSPVDIVMPGHVFPLCAKSGGVLQRNGHTEGSVDLARLAGLHPAAVICEIMNDDGSMARMPELITFAQTHDLNIISIHDLQTYRIKHEQLVEHAAEASIPVDGLGDFSINTYTSKLDASEIVVLSQPSHDVSKPPLVRLHSACLTGDVFGSGRCDCGAQLEQSLEVISREGGYVIYLPQEGRGIGLTNKIKAYALQEQGLDTVEANHQLGFADDLRDYGLAAQVLKELGICELRLMTNNPRKVDGLQRYGLDVVERVSIIVPPKESNIRYLQTKREKMGHWVADTSETIIEE